MTEPAKTCFPEPDPSRPGLPKTDPARPGFPKPEPSKTGLPVVCRICMIELMRRAERRRFWFLAVRRPLVWGMRALAAVNGVDVRSCAAANPECRGCLRFVKAELERRSASFRFLNRFVGPAFQKIREPLLVPAEVAEAKERAARMMAELGEGGPPSRGPSGDAGRPPSPGGASGAEGGPSSPGGPSGAGPPSPGGPALDEGPSPPASPGDAASRPDSAPGSETPPAPGRSGPDRAGPGQAGAEASAEAEEEAYGRRPVRLMLLLALGLFVLAVVGATHGRAPTPLGDLIELARLKLLGLETPKALRQAQVVIWDIRLPRIALAALVGGALSVSGAVYQGLFRNPMVAPDILGVSSGAGVGASLAIALDLPSALIHLAAFAFGLGAVALVVAVSLAAGRGRSLVVMILVGVVVSSLFGALGSFVKYLAADDQTLTTMVLWLMGSFARGSSWTNVGILAGACAASMIPLAMIRWRINALAFGEEEATAMGVDVPRLKMVIVACATLLTASSVAICGLIGWVGLLIPHLCRFVVGPNFQVLLPASLLAGGLFMLGVDTLVRLALPGEMPVGIVTSLAGAPLFIYVLCRSARKWS